MAQPNSCTPRQVMGTMGPVAAAAAVAGAAVAYLGIRLISRVQVVGGSMAPALAPGDRLLVIRWPRLVAPWPRPGEVVALRDPRDPARVLVKRVGSVDRHKGTVEVLGDDASASTDSRTFGPVSRSLVLGRAVYRYAPAGRVGRGPWLAWPPGYDRPEGDPPGWFRSDPNGSSATKGTA
jgi:nickel-type superoxide dismutase maturation protease